MNIIISGTDGAGKSTQAILLEIFLRNSNIRVLRIWSRSFPIFTYILYIYAKLTKRTIIIKKSNESIIPIHVFWVDRVLCNTYPYLLFLDTLFVISFIKVLASVLRCNVIIFDRSIIDTIIDIIWDCRSTHFLKKYGKFIGKYIDKYLSAKENIPIFFIASAKMATKRKKDIVNPVEISFKKKYYMLLATKYSNIIILDTTSLSISSVFNSLRILINERCAKEWRLQH